jgi:hypothetical protein
MKIFIYTLIVLAVALIIFNCTIIDIQNPTKGDSFVAIIGVLACCCTILLLSIFLLSRKIVEKTKGN